MNDASATQATRPSCLWLARELPFPPITGDRIYSGCLAAALAGADVDVEYLGFEVKDSRDLPTGPGPKWVGVAGNKRSYWLAVFSRLPLVAAAHDTAAMRRALDQMLERDWDAIVLDHYSTAWALERVKRNLRRRGARTVLIHIAQNHEEALAYALYQSFHGSLLRRAVLYMNYLKIRHWERRLTREVDVVGAITEEDREAFLRRRAVSDMLVLTPGYSGDPALTRTIDSSIGRRVVVIGSFRWVVKEQNLRQLLIAADHRFAENGISLDVVGDVAPELINEFGGQLKATIFHGLVADFRPFFERARIALVPEVIGGGFKLKFLDYIFRRVPVATLSDASAGVPGSVRRHFLQSDSLPALVEQVIANIDDLALLDRLQTDAYRAAEHLFRWQDRGALLADAIARHRVAA